MISKDFFQLLDDNLNRFDYGRFPALASLLRLVKEDGKLLVNQIAAQYPVGLISSEIINKASQQAFLLPVRELFADLQYLIGAVRAAEKELNASLLFGGVEEEIERTSRALEFFITKADIPFSTYQLFNQVDKLFSSIERIKRFSQAVNLNVYMDASFVDEHRYLSIKLDSQSNLKRFVMKISAIQIIVDELANLLNLPEDEKNIEILKVESGSLWLALIANPQIVGMVQGLLDNTINYFYRNFSREGKISTLPRAVESLDSIIELRKKLKALGINTDELDENIKKSSVVIAQELNILLIGESRVAVNNQSYFVGESFEKKYLEDSKALLLTDGNDYPAD